MSKRILIVESDTALSAQMQGALSARGFSVDQTTDGKGSVEQIRRDRPDLVVLAVDLGAGQNGYLICGKLKKDDELKAVPVVIVGSPDGFAQHRKLKAHADEYVAKPVDTNALVDAVGALVGFPELPGDGGGLADAAFEDSGLGLAGLDEEPLTSVTVSDDEGEVTVSTDYGAEEIAVVSEAHAGDPELDMLDAAFEDISEPGGGAQEERVVVEDEESLGAPPPALPSDDFGPLGGSDTEDVLGSLGAPTPPPEPVRAAPPPPPPPPAPARSYTSERPAVASFAAPVSSPTRPPLPSPADAAELRSLRARVAELQAALEDSQGQSADYESRVRELEAQAENHAHELEAARAASGRNDRETLTLRDAVGKKDKELLRLRGELHEKEQELVELRERAMTLEQQAGDSAGELARRDAQLKTLTTRADQAVADKRRVDVALQAAKEEARGATARLSALQAELDGLQGQAADADALRDRVAQLENELAGLRGEAEASQGALDDARHEADALRDQLERVQQDLEAARGELATQQAATGEELDGLRRRVAELEESTARHEERVTKLYARIKGDEKLREKAKKALGIAQQLLDEHPEAGLDLDGEAAA